MKIHTLNEKVYVERIQTNDEVNGLPFCGGNSSIFHVGPWEYVPFKVVAGTGLGFCPHQKHIKKYYDKRLVHTITYIGIYIYISC